MNWAHFIPSLLAWLVILANLLDMWKRRKELRQLKLSSFDLSKTTGLSELQIQVALDAAMATFAQRIHEMQETTTSGGEGW